MTSNINLVSLLKRSDCLRHLRG